MTNSREYWTWLGIKDRCLRVSNKAYKTYGARGIGISEAWLDFTTFYKDMGPRPSGGHSVERIDNNLGYSKENCKWATKLEQQNNTRRNVFVEFDGRRLTIGQWARERGINYQTLYMRIMCRGWDTKRSLEF